MFWKYAAMPKCDFNKVCFKIISIKLQSDWGNGWLFKRSILTFLFVVKFRKVLKDLLNLNTDDSISAVLIKNGSILNFIDLNGFWSASFLSQLEFFKVLVQGKVCFNLIKLSLFCFIYFLFLLLFLISFWCFVSFVLVFLPPSPSLPPQKKNLPPVGVRVWVSLRVRARIRGKFFSEAIVLEPFLPVGKKEIFFVPTKC